MRCLHCHKDGIHLNAEICPNCGVHLPSLMRDVLEPGKRLRSDTYQIEYALGRGGFGITYRAHHTLLEEVVAIKEFYPQEYALRNGSTGGLIVPKTDEEKYRSGKERFLKEGRILAKLRHENVVRVRDLFEERETAYLVMEVVAGKTLRQELEAQPVKKLPPARVEKIVGQLVAALEAVHAAGIYHLDIKPENVLLTAEGKVVLVDFGAAKQAATTSRSRSTRSFTEAYAAPEIIAMQAVGAESDIFELGMMLCEMVTGTLPEPSFSRVLMGDSWKPEGLAKPWRSLAAAALVLQRENRPNSVRKWWEVGISCSDSKTKLIPEPLATKPLSAFEFEVVTVNARGKESNRQRRQAEFFGEDLGGGVILEMVSIPGGTFLMGSSKSEPNRFNLESPQHRVSIAPFFMGKYPVTQAQWRVVAALPQVKMSLEPEPSRFKGDTLPVEGVSWDEALEFCARLSKKTGWAFRLPSEAEWEYACRAGTTTPFYFGETITPDLANYNGDYPYANAPTGTNREKTTPVGCFPPNAFGLYDMHGNVWEWCQDGWHDNYNGAPFDGSSWESNENDERVLRGGSWSSYAVYCRSAYRGWDAANRRSASCGFRVAVARLLPAS